MLSLANIFLEDKYNLLLLSTIQPSTHEKALLILNLSINYYEDILYENL